MIKLKKYHPVDKKNIKKQLTFNPTIL